MSREPIAEPPSAPVPGHLRAEMPKIPTFTGREPIAEPVGTTPAVPVFPVPPLGGTGTDPHQETT